ncbi:MAG TPA: 30S ribosome-binding factor RbfA [Coriobacteriia bacterium]|nr:30S ribosome-binding factor RbfA [Coriobacteriia bacterium]
MKSSPRTRKLGENVREALADVLLTEVQDPRVELATITSVQVSADLHFANVYVTTHGGQDEYDALLAGLRSADKRIRAGLARRVSMQFIPELRYFIDESVDEGMRIHEALKNVPEGLREASDVPEPHHDAPRTDAPEDAVVSED